MPMSDTDAAEFALKTYIFQETPEVPTESAQRQNLIDELRDSVDLTEAPEDAVCSLVIDLMHYCERRNIDWSADVMSRAVQCFRSEHTQPTLR